MSLDQWELTDQWELVDELELGDAEPAPDGWELTDPGLVPEGVDRRRTVNPGDTSCYNRPGDTEMLFEDGWPLCEAVLNQYTDPADEFRFGAPLSSDTYFMCAYERVSDSAYCDKHQDRE